MGIPVCLVPMDGTFSITHGWSKPEEYERTVKSITNALEEERPDVVITNTLYSFFVVDAATRLNIPVIWVLHEHYNRAKLVRSTR